MFRINILWLLLDKSFKIIISFFVSIAIVRYLGPESLGMFSYAQSILLIMISIVGLGLDDALIRYMVNCKLNDNIMELVSSVFWLRVMVAFFLILPVSLFYYIKNESFFFVITILILSLLFKSSITFDTYFQYLVKSKYTVWSSTLAILLSSVLKLVVVYFNLGLTVLCVVFLLESLLNLIFILYLYKSNGGRVLLKINLSLVIPLVIRALPLMFAGLIYALYSKIDQIIILNLLSEREAGLYSAATRLTEMWYFFPLILTGTFFPKIISDLKERPGNRDLIRAIYGVLTWIAVFPLLVVTFYSDSIISILYGADYVQSSNVLIIHMWCTIPLFFGVVSSKWLIANDKNISCFYRNLLGLSVNTCFSFLFVPKFGIVGAAYATLLSYFIAYLVFDLFTSFGRDMIVDKVVGVFDFSLIISFLRTNLRKN